MKTSSHISLTGPAGNEDVLSPFTRRGRIFLIYIAVGEEIFPSSSPNRGIPRGESSIGSTLPSLGGTDVTVIGLLHNKRMFTANRQLRDTRTIF
jgi:hypothetical protein